MLKAITLLQPWASLLAAGIKTIETRSWNTNHRGPLLIHASQKTDEPRQVYIMGREWMRELLAAKLGVHALADLPLGKIVGAGELTHAYRRRSCSTPALLVSWHRATSEQRSS
jgi:hypothetical protein